MEDLFKQVEAIADISDEAISEWNDLAESVITSGDVEKLSTKGLYEVIDLVAWHIATDVQHHQSGCYTDQEWTQFVMNKSVQLDEIQSIASLASKVHPMIVARAAALRAEYYNNLLAKRS